MVDRGIDIDPTGAKRHIDISRSSSPDSVAMKPSTWCRPSLTWASVTPFVYPGWPKGKRCDWDKRKLEMIHQACAYVGLPKPISVKALGHSKFHGAGASRQMPQYVGAIHEHVILEFPTPVNGPVLIGRGMFRGYGLFRPCSG
jgi:CRISPR-associated protein Csb2